MNAVAQILNNFCFCVPLDREKLDAYLVAKADVPDFAHLLATGHEHLFSASAMFVSRQDLDAMTQAVQVLEKVARDPIFIANVLSKAPEIALRNFGPLGVLMGYDFHLTEQGPKLIEINTNAGGVFLNDAARNVRSFCCTETSGIHSYGLETAGSFDNLITEMFRNEWRLQRGDRPLRTVAIVDAEPQNQYLYPEFLLAKSLLEKQGLEVFISAPEALIFNGKALQLGDVEIDLIYNRHTDFYLESAEMMAIRAAYEVDAVVLTPNPHHHAVHANKANLVLLSDADLVNELALTETERAALQVIPQTKTVTGDLANWFWENRKGLFFKPVSGHAGKAVYRGDKLTKSVFGHIMQGGYIAQEIVAPSHRQMELDGRKVDQKADIRLFTYNGQLILPAARLYQGQTTNFRTEGGGFAPVLITPET